MAMAHSHSAGAQHHGHHIVPRKTLLTIFGALLFLTILTVAQAELLELGALEVPIVLLIAGAKATLVALYFMALKWDSPVNRLAAVMGVVFVAIFLIFTMFDTLFRGDVGNVDPQTIQDIERQEQALQGAEPQGGTTMQQPAQGAAPADSAAAPGTANPDEAPVGQEIARGNDAPEE